MVRIECRGGCKVTRIARNHYEYCLRSHRTKSSRNESITAHVPANPRSSVGGASAPGGQGFRIRVYARLYDFLLVHLKPSCSVESLGAKTRAREPTLETLKRGYMRYSSHISAVAVHHRGQSVLSKFQQGSKSLGCPTVPVARPYTQRNCNTPTYAARL